MLNISKKKVITALLAVLAVIYIVSKTAIAAYLALPIHPEGTITVEPGSGASQVAQKLATEQHLRLPRVFAWLMKQRGIDDKISAGTIKLENVTNNETLMQALQNPVFDDLQITILEGWTIRDIAAYGKQQNLKALADIATITGPSALDYTKTKLKLRNFTTEYLFLRSKPTDASLEGYLFPDTYRIAKDATTEEIVQIMLTNFEKRVTVNPSEKSLFDIIRMASVIEREVQNPDDMAIVSDLFWRRLAIGMPLQADSTVNYVIGGDKPSITFEQTKINSPYNTYLHQGLPLGPISNPGAQAITAAANPKPNDYLFFLTDKEGNVHYGKTLEEHNANKRKYLR